MTILESLYDIAVNRGIDIMECSLPETASLSVCVNDRRYIGIDRTQFETVSEETVHIAHELGHCETSAFYDSGAGQSERSRNEKKATKWAIAQLVPPERFLKAYKSGCREIWEFAEELDIPCDFAEKVMLFYKRSKNWLT